MTISESDKLDLHRLVDEMLETREKLEKIDPSTLTPGIEFFDGWSQPRHDFILNACRFLRRLIGERLHAAELPELLDDDLHENTVDATNLASLANAIRSIYPILAPMRDGAEQSEFVFKMADDFIGIYWGDDPRFFSIGPKWQGQHKRPWRIARLRCRALDWEVFLAAAGLPAFERHRVISEAYRASWDTIRKWKNSIHEQFDYVPHLFGGPERARDEYNRDPDGVMKRLSKDGAAYWLEKSSAKVGKDS